ncbi:protein translocase subunit SecD [Nocardioides dongxiaopingii]|uniref:protein translocase subunit SecD n=1 Tax=Nocardioides TaxID=1839 RepID=UPI0010C76DD2|nr:MULTISPECIES: protein translocase subunit SecD [Nocardioides]QCW50961.1 protein translocase subunit SecD [Nocardioides sp. S-1144]
MAKKQARPGRTLVVFLLGTAILYGLVALAGSWKPALGLDLQGGTRITLNAQGDPSADSLDEARSIIDQRVNGSGISEAEVLTQGGRNVVVEIPGDVRQELVEVVERQAQLRFRLVACYDGTGGCTPPAAAAPTGELPPVAEDPAATEPPAEVPTTSAGPATGGESAPAGSNRVAPGFSQDTTTPPATDAPATDAPATDAPATDAPATDAPATGAPTSPAPGEGAAEASSDPNAVIPLEEGLAFMRGGYSQEDYNAYNAYQCSGDALISKVDTAPAGMDPAAFEALPAIPLDDPLAPLVACSPPEDAVGDTPATPSFKFLMSPAVIAGTDLKDASYGIPQNAVRYVVTLDLQGEGRDVFSAASRDMVDKNEQFAVVLDGTVITYPNFDGVITDGSAQISGNFTETQAKDLSTSLKYGSLPISFDSNSENIGPSLAGDQLSAGLLAGAFGLGLVLIYCLLYYRGLGLVVVASLLAAAAVTYALVLLLSETAGFTLTLPGIAGLIIAVGVTADSFIIFFERIRDEMREGKSMRVAVETGWKRAKVTRLAAQVVSLLSALVLYIFATGAVKGFGFALGLTTIVDLAILFWFTKPMVSWLARFRFFNSGHRLSGLSAGTLGIDGPGGGRAAVVPAGGKA